MFSPSLAGKRIVITRAEEQAGELAGALRVLGAQPLVYPAIEIAPPADLAALDAAIAQLSTYDWLILTSANAAHALFSRMSPAARAELQHVRVGAVGPATARALQVYGLAPPFMPSQATAEALVAEIGAVADQRVLFPRADIAREIVPHGLRQRGAVVDELIAYRTVSGSGMGELFDNLQRGTIDAVTFFSPSAVRHVLDGLTQATTSRACAQTALNRATLVCIGPTTTNAAEQAGLHVEITAREHSSEGVIAALVAWFGQQPTPR